MTNEEMERAIGFLLDSQESLTAKCDANTDAIAKLTEKVDANTEAITKLTTQVDALTGTVKVLVSSMQSMTTLAVRLEEAADQDRRIIRDVVQDLKDSIYLVNDKADRANRRLDGVEKRLSE